MKCNNGQLLEVDKVRRHLYYNGFSFGYTTWDKHGEIQEGNSSRCRNDSIDPRSETQHEEHNPYVRMVTDAFHPNVDSFGNDMYESIFEDQQPNPSATSFYSLLKDADEPLWPGCQTHTTLSAVSQLLNCKTEFNISEAGFNRLLGIMKGMLPDDDNLPQSFYELHKKLEKFGLSYVKIDACKNGCMLFDKEYADWEYCGICGHSRYKPISTPAGRGKKKPYKVLHYLPLIPRLQRLFMSSVTAQFMTWHAESRNSSGVISHPVDGEAWKHFDRIHQSFAADPRNVRLGLCADGFCPYGPASRSYSCWPVMLVVYNLPPWMCMKQPYLFLNMIIPGRYSPSNNIDVFLRPLIDELMLLWDQGVETYDAHKKQNFLLRAALLWTINDFPAYGMLSGWSTHGRLSCPYCMENTKAFRLQYGRKPCFFDCHRRFLPPNHPFRRQRDKFSKRVDHDSPIQRLSGEEVLQRLDGIEDLPFGIKCGKQKPLGFGVSHNWVKKSIFWKLPYWSTNLIRHNLDVMHIEKNVFDNVFNTLMDVKGKTKDNIQARMDMTVICKRKELELVKSNGRTLKPKASFTLTKKEQKRVCDWVKGLKLPDGFASNIARCVNVDECKFYGMKSHDCHIFMQRLLPIAIRDFVPNPIWDAITELSQFFRDICLPKIRVDHMQVLQRTL